MENSVVEVLQETNRQLAILASWTIAFSIVGCVFMAIVLAKWSMKK